MMYQRFLSFVLVLLFILSLSAPAMASEVETESGATIQLTRTSGDVTVTKSSDKPVSVREGMRLYNGYTITTEAESYAWINLDSSKLIKLDASSSAEIRKNGKLLEVNVSSGSAYFDVSKKLDSSENLNVRTATMAVGIRGTCGWASVENQLVSQVHLLEGACECAVSDPASGQAVTGELHDGETASCVVNPEAPTDAKCDIVISDVSTADIPGFVLMDVVQDISLCDAILENSGLDILSDLAAAAGGSSNGRSADGLSASLEVLGLAEQRVREAEVANAARLQQMQAAEAQQANYIARDNVFTAASAAVSDRADSRTGATPTQSAVSSIPAATIPPTAGAVQTLSPTTTTATATQAPQQTSAPTPVSTPAQSSSQTPQPSSAATASAQTTPSSTPAATPSVTPAPSSTSTAQPSSTPTSAQSSAPTSEPTSSASPQQSSIPAPSPSATPTAQPSSASTPTASPSAAPTEQPVSTSTPTLEPTSTQTLEPISTPTLAPISTPTPGPILIPTPEPVPVLTPEPVPTFTPEPTPALTPGPVLTPTLDPTPVLTPEPTAVWTPDPTPVPTPEPTPVPTPEPTPVPTAEPGPTYTITFHANGGTVVGDASAQTNSSGSLSVLPEATMQNGSSGAGEFLGWYTSATGGSKVTTETQFSSDTTVYAHWKGWSQSGTTVTIFGEGAIQDYYPNSSAWASENVQHVIIESGVTSIGTNAFYGCHSLVSVSIPSSVTSIGRLAFAECGSLTSIVIPNGVTSLGESCFSQCSNLTNVSIPASVTSIGSNAFTGCAEGLVVTYGGTQAQWNAISGLSSSGLTGKTVQCTDGSTTARRMMARRTWTAYAVALDAAGGTVETDMCWTDADGKLTELPIPEWEDHVFDGWYTAKTDGERVSLDTVFEEDATIFAHWKEEQASDADTPAGPFTIRLDGCGGTLEKTKLQTDEDGSLKELPKPVRNGYVFEGWYTAKTDGRRIVAGNVFREDTELYARWTAEEPAPSTSPIAQFSIRFDACGGTVQPASMKTNEDGTLASLPTPEWKDHSFSGWYTAETGGSKVSLSTAYTKNTTLYAHWKDSAQSSATPALDENVCTIRLDACGGTVGLDSLKTDKDGRLSSLPTPERENYTFQGWYTDPEGGTKVSTKTVFEKNTKLYAHWAEAKPAPSAEATAPASPEATDPKTETGSQPEQEDDENTPGSSEQD